MAIQENPAKQRAEQIISSELEEELPAAESVAGVERDEKQGRWYVRLTGADKDFTTIWFTLGDRMLHHETSFMPYAPENHLELYRYLLRLNRRLVGVQFALSYEEGIFLVGSLPIEYVSSEEIDRIIGTVYATVEAHWQTAMRIGFASKFGR